MRVAVISDTHNKIPPHMPGLLVDADEIWHLGDVCEEMVLDEIAAIGPRLRIVRGNCDSCLDWPLVLDLHREGLRIELVHIPPRFPNPGTDLLLHGHTHVARDEVIRGTRFLNPGPVTRPTKGAAPSFAWLEMKRGAAPAWSLQLLR